MDISFEKGMDLRTARHLMSPGSCLNATNLVPDTTGALVTRQGMTVVGSIPNTNMTGYYKLYGPPDHTYQGVINTLNQMLIYRDFTSVLIGPLGLGSFLDFCDMSEFQNDHSWVFFAAGQAGFRYRDDGAATFAWGINAPSQPVTTASAGTGTLNGTYTYRYIYARHNTPTNAIPVAWGNPSPPSAPITVTNQQVQLSNLTDPSQPGPDNDGQVTHRYIYRNQASNPDVWLLLDIRAIGINSYLDNSPDIVLPAASGLPSGLLEFDNGVPPVFSSITVHQNRIWGVTGADNRVWYSKAQRPEQFSATGYLEVGPLSDRAKIVKAFDGRLYVGTDSRLIPILGTDESSYIPDDTPLPVGVTSPFTVARGKNGLYWRSGDGVYLYNGASAQNITDAALYPIFHRESSNGFPPVSFGAHPFGPQYFSVGAWFEGRYYLTVATHPTNPYTAQTWVYDESSGTWYADSRVFARFFYDRQKQELIGTSPAGVAYRLNDGVLDNGQPIPWSFQSRDEVAKDPQSDFVLTELMVEIANLDAPASVSAVENYGAAIVSLGTISTTARQQVRLSPNPITIAGNALGYTITGQGRVQLFRLSPQLVIYPATRRGLDTLATDLGYPGPKRIVGLTVDSELIDAGPLAVFVFGDGIGQVSALVSTIGRSQIEGVTQSFDATLIQTFMRSPGRFRLYPNTFIAWIPLPMSRYTDSVLPVDLGYPGDKRILEVWLDTELLSAGILSPTLRADGQAITLTPQTTTGRRHANVLTQSVEASVIGLDLQSSALFRHWPGGMVVWQPLPTARRVDSMLPTDLGYTGAKRIIEIWLDLELLSPGTVTTTLLADGQVIPLTPISGVGRHHENVLTTAVEASIIGLELQSTVPFRRWPGGLIVWHPLPTSRTTDSMLPNDLGYPGPKRIVGVWLDTELLSAGVLTPTLLADGTAIPLQLQTAIGRHEQDVLTAMVDATIVEIRLQSTAPFRRWSDSFIAWVPLPPEYLVYDWPASTFGTADEKLLQAVSLDLELMGPGPVTLSVQFDHGLVVTFPFSGVGRHTTGRLRFPKTAHGRMIEYSITGSTYWRLWGGEFLYQVLGSHEGLQRFPLGKDPGSSGPDVQKTPFTAGSVSADAQRTPLTASAVSGDMQRTPLGSPPDGEVRRTPVAA